jgi:prophage DNA circulation protein
MANATRIRTEAGNEVDEAGSTAGFSAVPAHGWVAAQATAQITVRRRVRLLRRHRHLGRGRVRAAVNSGAMNAASIYAMISRMRVLSSPQVVKAAENIVRKTVDTYLAPNKTFPELRDMLYHDAVDPLREFSEALPRGVSDAWFVLRVTPQRGSAAVPEKRGLFRAGRAVGAS